MARITKHPDVRRQEILDTALLLFYEKGYEQTSMQDISKRMGVSQGLCYRYFASKEEVYAAALAAYVAEGVAAFEATFCQGNAPLHARLDALIDMDALRETRHGPDFFNKRGNAHFHTQMQLALCGRLYPLVQREIEKAQQTGEVAAGGNAGVLAAFCLYGQLGVEALAQTEADKLAETKKLLQKLLE